MWFRLLFTFLLSILSSQYLVQQSISLNNVESVTLLQQYTFEGATFRDLVFQPGYNRVAVAVRQRSAVTSLNGEVIFLDSKNLQPPLVSETNIFANALAFSPDGTLFAVGSEQGEIRVFKAQTQEPYVTLQAGLDIVNDIAISADNAYIGITQAIPTIVHEGDSAFRLFTLPEGHEIFSYPREADVYGGRVVFDKTDTVFFSTVNISNLIITIHYLKIVKNEELAIYEGQGSKGFDLLFDTESRKFFYIESAGVRTVFWDSVASQTSLIGSIQESETITQVAQHPIAPILAIAYSKQIPKPNNTSIVISTSIIRLYDTEKNTELINFGVYAGTITNLAFSPDGTLLASGGTDGTVRLWGVVDG